MFSRRNRRASSAQPAGPTFGTAEVAEAWAQLDVGDIPGALRKLRACTESAPLGEIAQVTGRAAEAAGFDDLRDAAVKVVGDSENGRALYDFGYACIERGVGYLAIPALREVVRTHPQAAGPRRELVAAYEDQDRHGEAVDLLLPHEDHLEDWPDRYLLVFNAVTSGRLLAPETPDASVEALRALKARTPGQILHEHASSWTDTPPVTADSVGLLAQSVTPPWGERLQGRSDHSGMDRLPADTRPETELAAEIVAASPETTSGDGATPPDPDAAFTSFAAAVARTWLQGPRDRVRAMGPVPSSRFN